MTKRRRPNLSEQVAILTRQAVCACGCGQKLEGRKIDYHHMHERALDGPDSADNWCAVVADNKMGKENNCHDRLTNGTKATTAGSSKHKIAKAKRLETARMALADAEKRTAPGAEKFERVSEIVRELAPPRYTRLSESLMLIPKPVRRPGKFPKRPPQKAKGKRR